ncbi:hypothetical protein B0H11DRAFT_2204892 [Mycena galericulata]|nr:hypothetical protein B0H11DRAFT_2204892 [Mycena galericulata]
MAAEGHVQDAPAPFSGPDPQNGNRLPDFILRSSDGVDFHVHRDILKFASDCFDSMFAFPIGNAEQMSRDGIQVLPLPETSPVLLRLLSLAYPALSVGQYVLGAANLDGFAAVYEAAHKYQFSDVQSLLGEMLDNSALLDTHPHRLFAIARLCDLPLIARKAALCTLKYSLAPPPSEFAEMERISWASVRKLQELHHLCGINAKRIAEYNAGALPISCLLLEDSSTKLSRRTQNDDTRKDFVWRIRGHGPRCGPRGGLVRDWFKNHTARLAARLLLVPSRDMVTAEVVNVAPADRAIIDACPVCSRHADCDLVNFARQLAVDVDCANNELGDQPILRRPGSDYAA